MDPSGGKGVVIFEVLISFFHHGQKVSSLKQVADVIIRYFSDADQNASQHRLGHAM